MFAEHLVLHSLGLCVAFLLALPVVWLARKDPVLGHRLLLILLVAGLVLPAFTLPLTGKASATGDRVLARLATEPSGAAHEPSSERAEPSATRSAQVAKPPLTGASGERDVPAQPRDAAAKRNGDSTAGTARKDALDSASGSIPSLALPSLALSAERARERANTTIPPRSNATPRSLRQRTRDAAIGFNAALRRATPSVIVAWILGVLLVGRRHLQRLIRTARVVRAATPVADDATLARWRIAAADHALAGRIELRRSDAVDAPACWGIAKPVILLPAVDATTPDATVFALRHELVHVERRDPLAALAQAVLKTVYWFHPVAWWLSAQIDRTRELACDQLVVANASQRKRYALALIDHARAASPACSDAPSIPRSPTLLHWAPTLPQLRRRIEMLLKKNTPLTLRRRWLVLGGAATAVVLLLAAQGTVAATLLSDAPLSERLVAFCPPKPTLAPNTRPVAPTPPIAPIAPNPPRKANRAKSPRPPRKPNSSSVTRVATPTPDSITQFDSATNAFLAATNSAMFGTIALASEKDPLRDALITVLTETSDQEARVTAAKALGTQLHDAAVRRAFARVLRDEWEGSEVREAVGDALLQSPQFSPEAHEIIAALLKREGASDPDDVAPVDTVEIDDADVDVDSDAQEFAELRAQLASDFEQLELSVDTLDLDTLDDLSDLKAEFGDLDRLSIDVGDAIDTLESCDDECDDDCETECEEKCEEDCDEDDDEASDRREAIVELLRAVRDQPSPAMKQHLMQTLLEMRDAGDTQVRLPELLRAMTAPPAGPNSIATPLLDRAQNTEDT